jgi:5,10-methenyltetrahydromethanopterin hydrogenase
VLVLSIVPVRVEKFIHGNIQKGDEFVKGVEDSVMAPVLDIHDGARGEVYKLGQMFLRPVFGLASALNFFAQGATIQAFFVLVHSHITPILFSGANMRTK